MRALCCPGCAFYHSKVLQQCGWSKSFQFLFYYTHFTPSHLCGTGSCHSAGPYAVTCEDLPHRFVCFGQECEKAMEYGASVIMINNWDRITGKLYPNQAMALRYMIPDVMLSIVAGGVDTVDKAAVLSDEGFDAVVLGRALAPGRGMENLIEGVVNRVGVPRNMLGMGIRAEELDNL
ncbi:unnamed protein product [Choristocarpus tenellus]